MPIELVLNVQRMSELEGSLEIISSNFLMQTKS